MPEGISPTLIIAGCKSMKCPVTPEESPCFAVSCHFWTVLYVTGDLPHIIIVIGKAVKPLKFINLNHNLNSFISN